VTPSLRTQLGTLARRSVARTLRQPMVFVPNAVLPLFLLAVLSSGGGQATKIPGFPTTSYTTFLLGAMLVQGAASAMTVAGNALATDIETGFLNRLILTPVRAAALIAAQLAGVAVIGLAQAILYVLVALAAGGSIKAGVAGFFVLLVIVLVMIVGFGSLGLFAALRLRSPELVQALFPLALGLLFLSSMFMPRNLISAHWFRTIATYNPMSYLVEANRSLLITGWNGEALALGCGIAALGATVALVSSAASLRGLIAHA
jgi:ABC-2 type transport system permease protein